MRTYRLLALALVSALAFAYAPAHADVTLTCDMHGSAASPAVVDATGDAVLGGIDPSVDPTTTPNDPTDVRSAWFETAADGTASVHVSLNNVLPESTNLMVYVAFDFPHPNPDPTATFKNIVTNFVAAELHPSASPAIAPSFQYGYLDTSTPGLATQTTQGFTSGSVTPGQPGEIAIDVPLAQLGAPQPGDVLTNLSVQTQVLIGAPGTGHPEISPAVASGSGLLLSADDTSNALQNCDDGITV